MKISENLECDHCGRRYFSTECYGKLQRTLIKPLESRDQIISVSVTVVKSFSDQKVARFSAWNRVDLCPRCLLEALRFITGNLSLRGE